MIKPKILVALLSAIMYLHIVKTPKLCWGNDPLSLLLRFLLGEEIQSVTRDGDTVTAKLESGKVVKGNCLLYTVGRSVLVCCTSIILTSPFSLES